MASGEGRRAGDLWSEVASTSGGGGNQIAVVYERRRAQEASTRKNPVIRSNGESRASFAPGKRTSWSRSLSIRGRESIFVAAGASLQAQSKPCGAPKRPPKPGARVKKTREWPPDFNKEKAYFQEVDAFELMEESPSPKNFGTWCMGMKECVVHDLPAILERWKISKLAYRCASAHPLFNIMETPISSSIHNNCSMANNSINKTPEKHVGSRFLSTRRTVPPRYADNSSKSSVNENSILASFNELNIEEEAVGASIPSLSGEALPAFAQLLMVCRQPAPVTLGEVFSAYCEPRSIVKLGEGTYGEAYRAGRTVCKVVPIDGDSLVNGEVQKKSEEVLEEVLLSLTLNNLREERGENNKDYSCNGFIETKDFRVCKGAYDPALVGAWEDWDAKNHSGNDHPKDFSDDQCYIVFILADGGKDLEGFVLHDYDEARSLLIQVTASLAVGEGACEFEHRDLHWGNVLLARDGAADRVSFTLEGKRMCARTFGLSISIIDFTLSRINTGDAILFLDLSADPGLFEGPKGDKQSETYRQMKKVTEEYWEGSFPKTNILWLIYLVDILLLKKSFKRTTKDVRELRSFKKRLGSYESARDCLADSFFSDLLLNEDLHPSALQLV